MTKKVIISILTSTVLLFLWSGITQFFPWGVPTAQTITTQSTNLSETFQTPDLIKLPSNSLTTDKFDELLVNKISTLSTDKTFSWIISKPVSYYSISNYFIKEIINQFIVAILIAFLLILTQQFSFKKRILTILIAGMLAFVSIYGQMMNWWGIPAIYAVGTGINLIIGWSLVSFISIKFILKSNKKDE